MCVRRISLDGDGNALYPVLSIVSLFIVRAGNFISNIFSAKTSAEDYYRMIGTRVLKLIYQGTT